MAKRKTSPLYFKRDSIINDMSEFEAYLNSITAGDASDVELTEASARIEAFEPTLTDFKAIQTEIELSFSPPLVDKEIRTDITSKYFNLMARARILTRRTPNTQQVPRSGAHVNLPAVSLPDFDGATERWVGFRDIFTSLVHNNSNIDEVVKLHYLKSSLKMARLNEIDALPITTENYQVAWKLLTDRYENKNILIFKHITSLLNLQKVNKANASSLRSMLDCCMKDLQILNGFDVPTKHWDLLIIHILLDKLDIDTRGRWEEQQNTDKLPTLEELKKFIEARARVLEMGEQINNTLQDRTVQGKIPTARSKQNSFITQQIKCTMCKSANHKIYQCPKFLALNAKARFEKVKELNICINCFSQEHTSRYCRKGTCNKCSGKHNTLLHFETKKDSWASDSKQEVALASFDSSTSNEVLLSTVLLDVMDAGGKRHLVRALLDNGSQSNLITSSLCKKLKLKLVPSSTSVAGISGAALQAKKSCSVNIKSRHNDYMLNLGCSVVNTICNRHPCFSYSSLNIPDGVPLADDGFGISSEIDMLLNASVFWSSLLSSRIFLDNSQSFLQETKFGFLVCGAIPTSQCSVEGKCCMIVELSDQVRRFWEIEEVSVHNTDISDFAEQHFTSTVQRDPNGRFIVSIPFESDPSILGKTHNIALRRFQNLERRLEADPSFKAAYHNFIKEYIDMSHMELSAHSDSSIYLPHHGVYKEQSTTTKLRVVFDGSVKTSSGKSLNDIQAIGHKLNDDLIDILIRFRQHEFVVSADIVKFYRQVRIATNDQNSQCILWRFSTNDPIQTYVLKTVTYGTASASFLATRCLKQLAIENKDNYQAASSVIATDFYVDDLLTGFDNIETGKEIIKQVDKILRSGGFELRKWSSNNNKLIDSFGSNISSKPDVILGEAEGRKTLGLLWNSTTDTLTYDITFDTQPSTKRQVLSLVSQIYDPMGLLSPAVIRMKILIQLLWLKGLNWDEPIPDSIIEPFNSFTHESEQLNPIQIPRKVIESNAHTIQIHGFADASERAYAAAIYIRSSNNQKSFSSYLLCAKTRVAPLKVENITRLELCAALLLTRLVQKVKSALNIKIDAIYLWSDSLVVLHWLRTPPRLLKTFVANRVSEIQATTVNMTWNHVRTHQNPADLASRGCSPIELMNCDLWWHGPTFLSLPDSEWCRGEQLLDIHVPEQKAEFTFVCISQPSSWFDQFSDYNKLLRITALCLRFLNNIKGNYKQKGPLTVQELAIARTRLIGLVQAECFPDEINILRNKNNIEKSTLSCLNLFLDDLGIIRVGGRLDNANLPFETQHPVLLPKHKFTEMLLTHTHVQLGHAGPQHLLYQVRQEFWPLGGRNMVRRVVHTCVRCYRVKPRIVSTKMASLPAGRVTAGHPFIVCGLDYAGPVLLRDRAGRNYKVIKAYIALFICFSTKAVHLELVGDLTSDAFLAALRRFVSRRGLPTEIHCDNGTNFVGGANDLRAMHEFVKDNNTYISNELAKQKIQFKFIPPHSPHMGGLWESGVKSAKFHIKRIIGLTKLTFEQYSTLLCQIESILNSRPLSPMSTDPNDLIPLSPSHFLLGRGSSSVCDPDLSHLAENRLSSYQHLQKMRQDFWRRWADEYLNNLQTLQRRLTKVTPINIGQLVLVRDENTPPMVWPMARVIATHPGKDGVTRVVTLKTAQGEIKRALAKICILPLSP